MFQLHVSSAPQLPWLLYLTNIAAASLMVCGLTLLAQRMWPRRTLPLRHSILLVGLLVTLAVPAIVGLIDAAGFSLIEISARAPGVAVGSAPVEAATIAAELSLGQPHTSSNPEELTDDRRPGPDGPVAFPATQATLGSADHAIERALDRSAEPASNWRYVAWAGFALLLVWCAGSLYEVYWFATGLVHVHRFLRTVEPVQDARLQRIARGAAHSLGLKTCPPLGQSLAIETPVSVGVIRGQVVLPARQLNEWSDDAWRALLLHEMAHLRRHDLLIGLVQRVAIVLYWWNPLLRRVSAHIAVLREQICDDLVTQHGSQEDRYAALIVELAGRVVSQRQLGPMLGAADGTPSELAGRIRRLLDPNRQLATTLGRTMKSAVAAFCVALVLGVGGTSIRWANAQDEEPPKPEAKPTTESPDAPTEVARAPKDAADTLHKKIRVVDEQGRPIVGATVIPWAIRDALGAHGSWAPRGMGRSEPPILTTDADGRATIPFPRYADPGERIPPVDVTCRIEHPGFVQTVYNDARVTESELSVEQTFAMQEGAQVEIVALDDGTPLPTERLYAQWSSDTFGLKPTVSSAGALILPRLPAGDQLLRVIYLPEAGPALFGDVQSLKLTNGQLYPLRVAMKPALQVAGRLADSVPRPIKDGRVVAEVINQLPSRHTIEWRTWATIAEDGTFTLEPVPPGDLQVIALCDGFSAKNGEAPAFASDTSRSPSRFGLPQVFPVDPDRQQITLQMIPTADCTIRVIDADGKPVPDAWIGFSPNVGWWNGGAQGYCRPLSSTAQTLTAPGPVHPVSAAKDELLYRAQTGADGIAVVRNLPVYDATFHVDHDKFQLPIEKQKRWARIALKPGSGNEITVRVEPKGTSFLGDVSERKVPPAAQATSLTVEPAPSRTVVTRAEPTELAGVVVDESGQPLPGVKVDAYTWFPGNETTTDQDGRFSLKGFDYEEELETEFTKPGYSPSLFTNRRAGGQNWIVILTQGTSLEGRVLDPQDTPVPKAAVRAWRGRLHPDGRVTNPVWTDAVTDEAGRYHLDLEPASYTIEVRVPGVGVAREQKVRIASKETKSLDLTLASGVSFDATVRDSITGNPVAGLILWHSRSSRCQASFA